jgi:tRNA pseudouridine38-40 synthase
MRIALGIEYDGSGYCGWQAQPHAPSVQEEVERALSTVADHPVEVVCAGRTDTGVHATAQVIHFDSDAGREMRSWVLGGNANLPDDISVQWALPVPDDYHARFGDTGRQNRYVILNRPARPAILRHRVCWTHRELDLGQMQAAAAHLLGEHDFSAFRAIGCQAKNPVRTLHRLDVTRSGDCIYIDVAANAFLHHMVRNIAGTLMTVGRGEQEPSWVEAVLAGRDRSLAGVTAPAGGLYFVNVLYPDTYGIPATPRLPVFA